MASKGRTYTFEMEDKEEEEEEESVSRGTSSIYVANATSKMLHVRVIYSTVRTSDTRSRKMAATLNPQDGVGIKVQDRPF